MVDAQINQKPVRLIADTGADWSCLDESLLQPLGLVIVKQSAPELGTLIPDDLSGAAVGVGKIGMHKLRVTTLENLQMGERTWKKIHFGVANLKAWKIEDPEKPARGAGGLLGMDMFLNHGVLIDFASRKLWFGPEKKKS